MFRPIEQMLDFSFLCFQKFQVQFYLEIVPHIGEPWQAPPAGLELTTPRDAVAATLHQHQAAEGLSINIIIIIFIITHNISLNGMESQIKLSQDSQTEVIFRDYSQYWNMILPGTGSEYHIISNAATKVQRYEHCYEQNFSVMCAKLGNIQRICSKSLLF